MGSLADEDMSNDAKWYTMMGEAPLRSMFETVLNLPSEFAQIDIDQQLSVFKERAKKEFGSDDMSIFSDPDVLQELITKYVVRDQLADFNASYSSNSIALSLLQGT
jgi:predicted methyltransferase